MRILTVLRSGGEYRPEHVQRLARMVPELEALADVDVHGVPTIPLLSSWPGWWAKMEAYRPDIEGDLLLMDLDTTVIRMPSIPTETTVLPDFYRPHLMGSGFMFVTADDRRRIWDAWIENPAAHMARCRARECWGDQGFLMPIIGQSKRWGSNVVSWKVHCKNGAPAEADVICFHGKPRPWDVEA